MTEARPRRHRSPAIINPEYPGDQVGRPADEADLARDNFNPDFNRPNLRQEKPRRKPTLKKR